MRTGSASIFRLVVGVGAECNGAVEVITLIGLSSEGQSRGRVRERASAESAISAFTLKEHHIAAWAEPQAWGLDILDV